MQTFQQACQAIGLQLNLRKCELVASGPVYKAALQARFPLP